MSICRVSAILGVLRVTLQDKIKGKTPIEMKKGTKPYLTEEIEDKIEDWLLEMARIGYGQTHRDILNKVQELVTKCNIPNSFPDGKPNSEVVQVVYEVTPNFEGKNGTSFES